jgi:protoporphyrin/coproporphyrin ferrochelatase
MNTTAVLLMNLGSPESPTTKDLKPYLSEFLMDERVIDVAAWLRTILVKGIIVPFRSPKSAAKYKTVWTKEGSPLVVFTKQVTQLVQQQIKHPVYYCMRYGNPSTKSVLQKIHADNPGLQQIILLPLYPHYAMSSYETGAEQVKEVHAAGGYTSSLNIVPPFYNHPFYIKALSSSIKPYLQDEYNHILFSYHGIPERHVKKTDCTEMHCLNVQGCCDMASAAHAFCYRHQVIATSNLVAQELGIEKRKYSFSFQSRLGRDEWLKPYTVKQLQDFPKQGIKNLVIACPAFVSDCLETLEEIAEEGKEIFMKAGGESFTLIPCLNTHPLWIKTIVELCGVAEKSS